jgi:hypothetical protein
MVYTTVGGSPDDRLTRELIATALREVADSVCRDHFGGITQEPQITSRIGQALEQRLVGSNFNGYTVEVVTQDFPDRGPGALERRVGADLYVGVRVVSERHVQLSKGMIAQAKKWPWLTPEDRFGVVEQSKRMLERSPASYVWVYTADGVGVVNAEKVVERRSRNLANRRRLDEVLSEILACNEGDPLRGLPSGQPLRQQVGVMLRELSVRTAVGVRVADIH